MSRGGTCGEPPRRAAADRRRGPLLHSPRGLDGGAKNGPVSGSHYAPGPTPQRPDPEAVQHDLPAVGGKSEPDCTVWTGKVEARLAALERRIDELTSAAMTDLAASHTKSQRCRRK